MSIYQILMKLKETSSINEKQNILQAEKDNENLMLFFKYALHPNMKFGIKNYLKDRMIVSISLETGSRFVLAC